MSAPASDFYALTPNGVRLHLRVTPNAGRDAIDGPETRDDGTCSLRVRVAAVPDKGKANAAVIALLAKTLKIAKSNIALVAGDLSRHKTLLLTGDPQILIKSLQQLAK